MIPVSTFAPSAVECRPLDFTRAGPYSFQCDFGGTRGDIPVKISRGPLRVTDRISNKMGTLPSYKVTDGSLFGMVDHWTESMTARERVETIATTLEEPRTANWVAEQAEVKWDTAKKHLDDLVDAGTLLVTDDDRYVPDPTRAYFDTLRELILDNSRSDLRAELEAIAERVDEWKTEYDVESIDDLEASLADDREPEDVGERRRVLRRWENSLRTRRTIQTALTLYDDVESLANQSKGSVIEGTG